MQHQYNNTAGNGSRSPSAQSHEADQTASSSARSVHSAQYGFHAKSVATGQLGQPNSHDLRYSPRGDNPPRHDSVQDILSVCRSPRSSQRCSKPTEVYFLVAAHDCFPPRIPGRASSGTRCCGPHEVVGTEPEEGIHFSTQCERLYDSTTVKINICGGVG